MTADRVSLAAVDAVVRGAVAQVAAGDPTPEDPFRGLYVTDDAALQLADGVDTSGADARLADVAARLGLDALDAAVLGLCAAPELDARYGRIVGYLHDDMTRRRPSPRLVARLLGGGSWPAADVLARLGAEARLRAVGALGLVAEEGDVPLADRGLVCDPLVVAALLGVALDADGPPPGVRDVAPGRVDDAVAARVRRAVEAAGGATVACLGPGADAVLGGALGCGLVVVDAARVADDAVVARARVRAALHGAALAVGALGDVRDEDRAGVAAALARLGPVFVVGEAGDAERLGVAAHVVAVPGLTAAARRSVWEDELPGADVGDVAARVGLTAAQIGSAAALARVAAAEHDRSSPSPDDLLDAGRRVARWSLGGLAQRLDGAWTWADLVLPADELAALRAIPAYVRHRERVLGEWGLGAAPGIGDGLTILFAGASGTGKTMAAQAIANDLGVEGYRIDLSGVVSKYIGETERNLERVFAAAEDADVLLVFDEADALFGKRSAVSDARDRYANLEVAYLLQRIERHPGVVILTTNLRQDIDTAFLRRVDVAIEFPVPSAESRHELWRRHLPPSAPLADDVDLERLARAHELPGGAIRTSVRAAAFAAADDGGTITMPHLEDAIRLELRKLGRLAAGDEERWDGT